MHCIKCNYSLDPTANFCPLCGAAATSNAGDLPQQQHAPHKRVDLSLLNDLRDILIAPRTFFATLSVSHNPFRAWLFALTAGSLGILGTLYVPGFSTIVDSLKPESAPIVTETISALLFAPLVTVISIWFWALYSQAMLSLTKTAKKPLSATLEATCYLQAPLILSLIPIFGAIMAFIWFVVIWIAGLASLHNASRRRTAVVLLAPVLGLAILLFTVFASLLTGGVIAAGMVKEIANFAR